MKNIKKIIPLFVICFAVFGLFEITASKQVSAATYSISAKYSSNGSVTVTYSGVSTSNKDWIGIYKYGTTPSSAAADAALAWVYPSSSSGKVTFSSSDFINSTYSPQKGSALEDGKYKAVILKSNGYTVGAKSTFYVGEENPNYEFDVYSDSHIVSSTSADSSTLNAALKDIKNFAPDSSAIVSNGDTVDQSDWSLYETLRTIYYNNKAGLPPVYFNLGNHELFDTSANGGNYNASSFDSKFYNYFLYFSKNIHYSLTGSTLASDDRTVPYYEEEVEGNHFIFLASESVNAGDKMDLSTTQLNWLDNKLWHIQNDEGDQPVFIFAHGSLSNTVAGSYSYQGWNGVSQDSQLKFILNKYPNAVYISAHSHWNLTAAHTMFEGTATYGGGVGATCVNDGALTNLWSDNGGVSGSQGLHIMVYDDKIIIKGRDYANKKWISGARYVVDLDNHFDSLHNIY